jgi:hypothetical protein
MPKLILAQVLLTMGPEAGLRLLSWPVVQLIFSKHEIDFFCEPLQKAIDIGERHESPVRRGEGNGPTKWL